jgi:segregation and condensation protein A
MHNKKENGFEIRLPQFEGPFDLLLFFIERDELDINDIPIAKITDDFLEYIQQMHALNIEVASEFIYMAATLMRIKVKTLLPRPELDEEGNEIDLQQNLIQKLLVYKQFKEICENLRKLEDQRWVIHKRGNIEADLKIAAKSAPEGEELASFNLYKLMMMYEKMMQQYTNRTQEARHTVVRYPYTIEEQKETIAALLAINKKIDFDTLRRTSENKVQFVYSFLAMLEMLQQQLVDIQIGIGYNNFWVSQKSV